MSESLKDILSNLNPDVDQSALMEYLQGKLSVTEQHELEKQMMEDEFTSDALEGLQDFQDKKKLLLLVDQLNADLSKRTEKKKRFREKLRLELSPSVIFALIIVLLLIVISFIIVKKATGK